jgi:DNA-binding transcriptional regulator YhcF (GntR family)
MDFPELIDSSRHSNSEVKHFAGTSTYQKTVNIESDLLGKGHKVILDLGEMNDIAEVKVNEKNPGVLWYPPYSVDITEAISKGENQLEITVTNNWANRLIGDEQEPADFEWGKDRGEKMGRAMLAYPDWFIKNESRGSGTFRGEAGVLYKAIIMFEELFKLELNSLSYCYIGFNNLYICIVLPRGMIMKKLFDIQFEDNQSIPKYRQIIDAIQQKIKAGELKKGDKILSLNMFCRQYGLSQDTVLMAYNELKSKGIITSQVGKGYFIQNENTDYRHKVLLVFDRLTAYKEELYDSFKVALQKDGSEQIFFHHNNLKMFQTIIEGATGDYSEYVIMPIDNPDVPAMLEKLPSGKVFILDQGRKQYKELYPHVCQDFERDIYRVLKKNGQLVNKYQRMVLVIRHQKSHFKDITVGFRDFCKQHPVAFEIANNIKSFEITTGDAFVVVDDRDLEFLVRYSIEHQLQLGAEIGIVSYNETPLKGIVASGITTISTDFAQMGKSMAEMVLNHQKSKIDNPFVMNLRNSY